jgi:hypothetical protein
VALAVPLVTAAYRFGGSVKLCPRSVGRAMMSVPGFTASSAVYGSRERVIPALLERGVDPKSQDCYLDCIDSCPPSGAAATACKADCSRKCRADFPPYVCKPQDNSANHDLCIAGLGAWAGGVLFDCFALGQIDKCVKPVLDLTVQMAGQCPPATICV